MVDLDKAPRDAHGLVHFAADFMILKPVDLSRGNRRVFYDYGNRGHKRALQFFNDAPHSNDPLSLSHAGNGFFMRRGYSVAWVAWEGDMLPGDGRMVLDVPVATDNGQPITGRIRVEFIPDAPGATSYPLSGRVAGAFVPHRVDGHARRGVHPTALPVRSRRKSFLPTNGHSPLKSSDWAPKPRSPNEPSRHPTGTFIIRPGSIQAGSTNCSIPRKTRKSWASATSRCAISSAS